MKEVRHVVGMMSGTSVDGVDAALVEISGTDSEPKVKLLAFENKPYPPQVREKIFSLFTPANATVDKVGYMNFLLGEIYAKSALSVIEKAGLKPEDIDAVGSHGQTIWHAPIPESPDGIPVAYTVQIGEGSVIAERTGITTVSDFRVSDMAAGGQGAPLVPFSEYLLYRREKETILLQNIGGIGNMTVMPAGAKPRDIFAFDTGPGNMVMDQLVARMTGGEKRFDEGGKLAAQGHVHPGLLAFMMQDPYLKRKPPKTSGRDCYGAPYVDALVREAEALGVSPLDQLATATRFTAECIRSAIENDCTAKPEKLIVGGGGSQNPTLMAMLADCLPGVRVLRNEDLGLDSNAKEAVAFALLANEYLFQNCGNVCRVTGARHPVVLGKLSL